MKKMFSMLVTLLAGIMTPVTAQQTFFCERNQWANAEQVAGAEALTLSFPDIVDTFWSDLRAGNMMLNDGERRTLMDAGNKMTATIFGVLLETAGIAAVLRRADENRINSIMTSLRLQLTEMSNGVEPFGPMTYGDFRRAAIRCVANYDGEEEEEDK